MALLTANQEVATQKSSHPPIAALPALILAKPNSLSVNMTALELENQTESGRVSLLGILARDRRWSTYTGRHKGSSSAPFRAQCSWGGTQYPATCRQQGGPAIGCQRLLWDSVTRDAPSGRHAVPAVCLRDFSSSLRRNRLQHWEGGLARSSGRRDGRVSA